MAGFCWVYRLGPIDCDLVYGLVNTNKAFHAKMVSEHSLDESGGAKGIILVNTMNRTINIQVGDIQCVEQVIHDGWVFATQNS